jgi:hypothetical protein
MTAMAGTIFDVLSKERKSKAVVVVEHLDELGVVRRLRVNDQSLFDAFLVYELISRSEHEGSIYFLEDLERAGVFPASVDLGKASYTPSYKVGDAVSARWMAFSSAYRFACSDSGRVSANHLMALIPNIYSWNFTVGKSNLRTRAKRIRGALGSLAKFYGCEGREDPRELIRSKIQK